MERMSTFWTCVSYLGSLLITINFKARNSNTKLASFLHVMAFIVLKVDAIPGQKTIL